MEDYQAIILDLHSIISTIIKSDVTVPEFARNTGMYGMEILHNICDLGCVMVDQDGSLKVVDMNILDFASAEIGVSGAITISDLDVGLIDTVKLFVSLIKQLTESKQLEI